jgi:hydroxypyruvate isomerase
MNRREFIAAGGAIGAAVGMGMTTAKAAEEKKSSKASFRMKYAPHFGMFRNHAKGDLDQVKFAADQGFTAWEDNGMMRRPVEFQNEFAKVMESCGMTMGVFVSSGGFGGSEFVSSTSKDLHDRLRKQMKKAVEVAKRVNATWSTFVPGGVNQKLEDDYMTANCIENLKVCAEVCEPAGLVLVLEPLNWWTNHPGRYLKEIPQSYLVCRGVDSPSVKILDDLYHQQIQEGNLIPNMEKAWDEIAYIQVGDNPGRKEPTTGEINYKNIFKYLHDKGYEGVIGMEHGNSQKGPEGEQAVIDAYRACDSF